LDGRMDEGGEKKEWREGCMREDGC
jgi:hypothetical protein